MADILNIIINTSSWVMTVVLFVLITKEVKWSYKERSKLIEKLEDEIQEKKGK